MNLLCVARLASRARFMALAGSSLIACTLLSEADARAGNLEYETIVLSGLSGHGLPSNLVLDFFGTPCLDHQGNIAFLAASIQSPSVALPFWDSVWKTTPRGLDLVAQMNDPAPGTPNTFLDLFRPRIAAGKISFDAQITQPGMFTGPQGVWSDRYGALERVMLYGDHPGMTPANSSFFNVSHVLCENGAVMLGGIYDAPDPFNPGQVDIDNEGVWRNVVTSQHDGVAVRHMPAPGTESGVVFDAGVDVAFDGPIDNWWISAATGRAAVVGYLGGPGITTFNDEGIWLEGPRGLELLVREGDIAPGLPPMLDENGQPVTTFLAFDGGFNTFGHDNGPIHMNRHGQVVFHAEIFLKDTLWTNRNGKLECLAATDLLIVPGAPPDPPAPGFSLPDQEYGAFLDSIINDSGNILADGITLDPYPSSTVGQQQFWVRSMWADHLGEQTLIVRRDDPVPGVLGLVFTNVIFPRGYGPDGTIYFAALLDANGLVNPVSNASDYGLFLAEPDGTIHTIVTTQQTFFEVAPGDLRIISQIFPGPNEGTPAPGIADDGSITFQLNFTDGTSGIFKAHAPATEVPGDITGDGAVNVDDLIAVITSWGQCAAFPATCPADVTGDHQVNIDDLLLVIVHWG